MGLEAILDPTAIYSRIENGGPAVIFVLLVVISLLLSGQIRPKVAVEREREATERAHKAELEARDHQIAATLKSYEEMRERVDREHKLFEQALELIQRDLIPMLRSGSGGRSRT